MSKRLFGFDLIEETSQGISDFILVFDFVWTGYFSAKDQDAIASKLKRVVWTDQTSRAASSEELVFVSSRMVGDLNAMAAVARELRRIWQEVTDFEASPIAARLGAEVDRAKFAAAIVGAEASTALKLIEAGLPTDDDFLLVAMEWPELSELKKLFILEVIAGNQIDAETLRMKQVIY